MKLHRINLPLILVLLAASVVAAQTTSVDFEAGFQWTDITGNEDMHRSQINDDDGLVIRDFRLNIVDPGGNRLYDRLVIEASGFGGDPSGRFALSAGKGDQYRLKLNYLQSEYYNALPGLANPFLGDGVIPGQHILDKDRRMMSMELELLPGKKFSPVVGYRWNLYDGPSQTTYHVGQDEFRLNTELEETEHEFYVGVNMKAGNFAGTLIQGWRMYEGEEKSSLMPGAGEGNNSHDLLGQQVTAESIDRISETEVDTPFTTFHLAGTLGSRVKMRTSFVRADADAETDSYEMLSGSLVSYRIYHFFEGLIDTVSSRTKNPSWRGTLEFQVDLSDHFNLDVGFEKRDSEMDGAGLITRLYFDTMTFGGIDTGDITDILETRNSIRRDEQTLNLKLNLTQVGPFEFWAGGSVTDMDLDINQDIAEIVVPGSQSGSFSREISRYFLGSTVHVGKARFHLDWQTEDSDDPIMRTDFTDRQRLRFRLNAPLFKMLQLNGTMEDVESDNESSGIMYTAETRHYAVDLGFTPVDFFTLRVTWDAYDSESSMPIHNPYPYEPASSFYTDDGTLFEGQVELTFDRFRIDAGVSSFENEGSFELAFDRLFARVEVELTKRVSAALEMMSYDYSEELFAAADFESERYGVYFKFHY